MISLSNGSITSTQKPCRWMRPSLILLIRIYTSIPTRTHPKNSVIAVDGFSIKNLLPYNISDIILKTIPISKRIIKPYSRKTRFSPWAKRKVDGNWSFIRNFSMRGMPLQNNGLRNQSKRTRLWASQTEIWLWKLITWVRLL